MKRFTETEKWSDPWFRALPPNYKLLALYIWDHCNAVGIWDPDMGLSQFSIGGEINEAEAVRVLAPKIIVRPDGKWFSVNYIKHQFPTVNAANKYHQKMLSLATEYGISVDTRKSPAKGPPSPSKNNGHSGPPPAPPGAQTPSTARQDPAATTPPAKEAGLPDADDPKIAKQKERRLTMKKYLAFGWQRDKEETWLPDEEAWLDELCKRPKADAEAVDIGLWHRWYPEPRNFLPKEFKTMLAVFQNWQMAVDTAKADERPRKTHARWTRHEFYRTHVRLGWHDYDLTQPFPPRTKFKDNEDGEHQYTVFKAGFEQEQIRRADPKYRYPEFNPNKED